MSFRCEFLLFLPVKSQSTHNKFRNLSAAVAESESSALDSFSSRCLGMLDHTNIIHVIGKAIVCTSYEDYRRFVFRFTSKSITMKLDDKTALKIGSIAAAGFALSGWIAPKQYQVGFEKSTLLLPTWPPSNASH